MITTLLTVVVTGIINVDVIFMREDITPTLADVSVTATVITTSAKIATVTDTTAETTKKIGLWISKLPFSAWDISHADFFIHY